MILFRQFCLIIITLFSGFNLNAQNHQTTIKDRSLLEKQFIKELKKINENIYVAIGYGASNPTMIIGDEGLIIVDAMMSIEAAKIALEDFKKIKNLPVKAIIYTHSHGDHRGGASVFADKYMHDIYARKVPSTSLRGYDKIDDIIHLRSKRQFGSSLIPGEKISGIAKVNRLSGGAYEGIIEPTILLEESRTNLSICGVNVDLVAAPGETDDHLYVWLPDSKVLLCGDNFYNSYPNLYAIRGAQYRDITLWIESLEKIISEEAEVLISGHAQPIIGKNKVKEVLTNYKEALSFVYEKTMEGINLGYTPDELVAFVKLPKSLDSLDYLKEYYGVIEWSVRAIYSGYLGWFDGNPSNLFPLNPMEESIKVLQLIGSNELVIKRISLAIENEEYQWACQLSDHFLNVNPDKNQVKKLKAKALYALAEMQISSNARHYFITVAKELEGVLD